MGVEKTRRQVAQPYTQTSAGSTSVGAFTVDSSASEVHFDVTGTAQEIEILISSNYTVYAADDIYWEIARSADGVDTTPSTTVTAATTSSPVLPGGQYFNFYFTEGQKISVIASGTVAFQMLPSVE